MKHRIVIKPKIRFTVVFLSIALMLSPVALGIPELFQTATVSEPRVVSMVTQEIEIPPDSDYYIRFDPENNRLIPEDTVPSAQGLSEKSIAAIAKSPRWIQPRLTSQFHDLDNPEDYADVLLNASKKYADEIAFSIACCPGGRVPSADLLKENAITLYELDEWINYADIIDYDDGSGDYYSTLQYTVRENGTEQYFLLPPDIYYWYVVHPKITNEDIDAVYGPLWRGYLFDHNDLGYPLLKEKLQGIQYLWDCESYYQPGNRLWSVCINQHPTALEALSYWIGKTVPYPAIGDRPVQASIIAHEHNGWCGELQKIAVAALRTALVPSIAASNVGEDHVWREFYERGWHENDNWWSDTGGAVDKPDVYGYNWGKNMSAIYQWRGDGTILQDTARYIHPEDRITVDFLVKDIYGKPVDGARVITLVKGPKDITYYTNLILEKLQSIWDKLPEFLKGRLLSVLYEKIQERIAAVPDSINGVTITTWNYTNSDGRCCFELGKNIEYLFLIQEGNLKKPWQFARHNTLRRLKTGQDASFTVLLLDVSHRPLQRTVEALPSGDCQFHMNLHCQGYQLQKHFINDGVGRHESISKLECFFVDSENFQRYQQGESFLCYHYLDVTSAIETVSTIPQEWYLVFRNYGRQTHVILNLSVDASVQTDRDYLQIVLPDSSVFETPLFNAGDTIIISGIASTDMVFLSIDHHPDVIECPVVNTTWSYQWNTSGVPLGTHVITAAVNEEIFDECPVKVIDGIPPSVSLDNPSQGAILETGVLLISGRSSDNYGVEYVSVTLNNITHIASGTTTWDFTWDLTGFPLGEYFLVVQAVDTQGLVSVLPCSFVLNESGHTWGPEIVEFYHSPGNLTNESNVVIFADVTVTGPFSVDQVIFFYDDGTDTMSYEMYRYGDFPGQNRHEEDPLINQSNEPVYGKELGQFSSGQTISYWIVVSDTARNRIQSEVASFSIM
jgi:hypothetical protein